MPEGAELKSASPCSVHGDNCPFAQEVERLRGELETVNALTLTDELTGLFNYRHFHHSLDLEMERSRRTGHPVSLILMDLDYFKRFNDHWGHESGNRVLEHVARIVRSTLRRLDIPCRYGGEEFAIILPDTSLRAAIRLADRLRLSIAESMLEVEGEHLPITASFGVDCLKGSELIDGHAFVAQVDAWLYEAKHAGRNCVRHAPDTVETQVSKEERDLLLGNF